MSDKVTKNKVVTMHYTVTDGDGNQVDSSVGQDPMEYLHGHNQIISGLSDAMQGRKAGEKFKVTVPPAKAYGPYKKNLIFNIDRAKLKGADELKVGAMMQLTDQRGHPVVVTIMELRDGEVIVDANHPLAGKSLDFEVEVVALREATKQELEHGHAHSAGGHGEGCC